MADAHARPPEVDRAAASRRAVAARRERASLKKDVAMRVISPQELAAAGARRPDVARRRDAGDGVPDEHPGDRRGQARPHPAGARDLAGEAARRARRPPAPRAARRSSTRGGPSRGRAAGAAGSSCSPARRPSARARSPRTSRQHHPEIHLSVSATTRPPRPGRGRRASTTSSSTTPSSTASSPTASCSSTRRCTTGTATARRGARSRRRSPTGSTVLLEIDLQGARQVREAEPSATLVFLLPPSWDELVQRLVGRGTEGAEERARRLRTAKVELAVAERVRFPRRERGRRLGGAERS